MIPSAYTEETADWSWLLADGGIDRLRGASALHARGLGKPRWYEPPVSINCLTAASGAAPWFIDDCVTKLIAGGGALWMSACP